MEIPRQNSSGGPSSMNESASYMCSEEDLDDVPADMEEDVEGECGEDEDDIEYDCFTEDDDDIEEECDDEGDEDDIEEESIYAGDEVDEDNGAIIGTVHDIVSLDLKNIIPYDLRNVQFLSLEMAYKFYYWFGRFNGFGVRKSKVLKNKRGEKLQQTFVCYRQGFREDRGLSMENRKRDIRPETRCGCEAKFRVHVDTNCGLWYITYFHDDHKHELLQDIHCRMLASHRTMTDLDVMQLNNMRAAGIATPHIYGSIANQCGGYDRVGYRKKDLYNQTGRQRKLKNVDAKGALQYLKTLATNDRLMYFRHTVDGDNRLQHLFWSDGSMQLDYSVFGDVLAFDATYGKNKYECPLVIFSGVNHHNNTCVFAVAVVANEIEETYVWLLEQFLQAMKGKYPVSVITDGDLAIKNSIRRVFPNSHHRLCAWHLLRNATSNICNPKFTRQLRKCMLGDYEVGEFKQKWEEMITKFEVQHHPWVLDLYEKRRMWSTAYIRGSFFAGFRTTSRCEALHSQISKFVYSRYNLTELLQHLIRWLNCMRQREVEADFDSNHGDIVLRTHYKNLERFAGKMFTKEIFKLFRPVLDKCGTIQVVGCKESFQYLIYTVRKYEVSKRVWHVSFQPLTHDVKCSCRRMESFGLPCDHILSLLVFLNISELPTSLILLRWTKFAKEDAGTSTTGNNFWGSEKDARYLSLMECYKQVAVMACETFDEYDEQRKKAMNERNYLLAKKAAETDGNAQSSQAVHNGVNDPAIVRTKGGRSHKNASSSIGSRGMMKKKCSICKQPGHNKRRCPTVANDSIRPESTWDNTIETANEEYVHDESAVGVECDSLQASPYSSQYDA